jgi:hypothetical protein
MPGLERRLLAEITGDVLFDRFNRGRYATDASAYQVLVGAFISTHIPSLTAGSVRRKVMAKA